MKTGRNDACPCGSGKKYKKCCLAKDNAATAERIRREQDGPPITAFQAPAAASATSKLPQAPLRPVPPPDPLTEAINARWELFKAADYEGQIELFERTLNEPELMDDENAFEMLSTLHSQCVEHNDRARFTGLVNALRERLPDRYSNSAKYIVSWIVEDALATGATQTLRAMTQEIAACAGPNIDIYNRIAVALAYHDEFDMLVDIMRLAWPDVKHSADIVPWGIDEFTDLAAHYELCAYVERTAAPAADSVELLERLSYYDEEPQLDFVARNLDLLQGKNSRTWKLNDFKLKPPAPRDAWDDGCADDEEEEDEQNDEAEEKAPADPGRQNLYDLSIEFLGFLHREEKVSFSRGELARGNLFVYLCQRQAGELERRDAAFAEGRQKKRSTAGRQAQRHLLCPDRDTLDHFLGNQLGFLNFQFHEVAATFELIPAWLRFLQSRDLIAAQDGQKVLRALVPLSKQLSNLWEKQHEDPQLYQRLHECWPADEKQALSGRPAGDIG